MTVDRKARRNAIDPAVNAHFGDVSIPQIDIRERTKKRAADEKRRGKRAAWDIDPELKAVIAEIAEKARTSQSQVASYLIVAGLQAIKQGIVPSPEEAETEKSRSLQFERDLKIPPIPK